MHHGPFHHGAHLVRPGEFHIQDRDRRLRPAGERSRVARKANTHLLEAKRAEVAAQRDTLEQAKDRLAAADAAAKEQLERTQAELAEANRLLEEAQTDAERSQLTAAIANLRASAAAGQAQIASNAADLAAVKVSIAGANTALESMDKILAEYKNPTDPLGQTVHNIAPFLPEPIRLPLVWGITLAIPLFRLAKVNGAFNSVVRSFEALKEAAPNVEQAIAGWLEASEENGNNGGVLLE